MQKSLRYAAALGVAVVALALVGGGGPARADENARNHQVMSGDNLWKIADAYDVSVDQLVKLNDIKFPDLVLPGQVIKLPGGPPTPGTIEYEVKAGETLSHVAIWFDVSVESLKEVNQISEVRHIRPGQKLKIPGAKLPPSEPEAQAVRRPLVDPELDRTIEAAAAEFGLNPRMVKAVAWVESGWQQHAVSPAGAMGIMQVTPTTAQWLEQSVFGFQLNEDVSVHDNIKMGTRYLRLLLEATRGDEDLAIASYYQGYGITAAGNLYEETKVYVAAVRAVQSNYWPG
jgi:N-acetylmuramoyl-L-alanine amidase